MNLDDVGYCTETESIHIYSNHDDEDDNSIIMSDDDLVSSDIGLLSPYNDQMISPGHELPLSSDEETYFDHVMSQITNDESEIEAIINQQRETDENMVHDSDDISTTPEDDLLLLQALESVEQNLYLLDNRVNLLPNSQLNRLFNYVKQRHEIELAINDLKTQIANYNCQIEQKISFQACLADNSGPNVNIMYERSIGWSGSKVRKKTLLNAYLIDFSLHELVAIIQTDIELLRNNSRWTNSHLQNMTKYWEHVQQIITDIEEELDVTVTVIT